MARDPERTKRKILDAAVEEFESAVKDTLANHGDGETFPEENEFLLRIGHREQD